MRHRACMQRLLCMRTPARLGVADGAIDVTSAAVGKVSDLGPALRKPYSAEALTIWVLGRPKKPFARRADAANPAVRDPQRSRYVLGHVANPTFGDIKANDANRVLVLAFQQIVDDSFKIGVFNVCLAPGTTHSAEVVEDQIDIPVDAGDDRW